MSHQVSPYVILEELEELMKGNAKITGMSSLSKEIKQKQFTKVKAAAQVVTPEAPPERSDDIISKGKRKAPPIDPRKGKKSKL
jgi:hypothetical protein